ncbi:MAG TPA: ATP-binding protein [Methylomusa anaerophila]|nr:PAS domain-containing sensor histidine kinase [Methylomusa anaerophila]HML87882.1 ATP-binding protein [Methylomusa anaerophila]
MIIFAVREVNSETARTFQQMEQSLVRQEYALDKWFNICHEDINSLANLDSIKKVDKEMMVSDFTTFLHNHKYFDNIIYVNQVGLTEIDMQHGPELYRGDQPYFQKALSGQNYISDIIQTKTDNQPKIIFSAPIYGYSGDFQGLLAGIANLSAIDALMQEFIFSQTGKTYLVNQDGLFLSGAGDVNGENSASLPLPLPRLQYKINTLAVNQALEGNTDTSVYTGYDKQPVFGAYRRLSTHNWAIVSEINAIEVLTPIYQQLLHMFLGFLLVLLLSLPLSLVMSRNIKIPIGRLIEGTRQMQKPGGMSFIAKQLASAPRELQELCDTFNQMAATISNHSQQLETTVKNRTQNLLVLNRQLQQEIFERQQAEALLRQSEEKYRMLVNNATDAIFLYEIYRNEWDDRDKITTGKFIEVNNIACERLGYAKEELMELTPADIDYKLRTGTALPAYSIINPNVNNQTIFETIHVAKDGTTIPVEVSLQFFRLNGLPVALAIARDISERKKVEQELARLDRLNLVGEMAANIGHEIRNPLTTVRGFLQLLGRRSENSANLEHYNVMIEELDRANSIITEFLSMAKNKAVQMETASLNHIIRVLHPLLQADAIVTNKQIDLELGDIPDICIDQKEIRQLILNLARNGLEAMQTSGHLTIRTFKDTGAVVLAVQDEGSGIPQEMLTKLGTPFLTTKEQGTGLGLSICYSIAHRHGATITLDTGNTGTTFFVRFKG